MSIKKKRNASVLLNGNPTTDDFLIAACISIRDSNIVPVPVVGIVVLMSESVNLRHDMKSHHSCYVISSSIEMVIVCRKLSFGLVTKDMWLMSLL